MQNKMKKFSDFEKEKKQSFNKELYAKASLLGFDGYSVSYIKTNEFGLCNDCKSLELVKSEFKILLARCSEFKINLNETEVVTECTCYEQRNSLTLDEMKNIAYIIEDVKGIGF